MQHHGFFLNLYLSISRYGSYILIQKGRTTDTRPGIISKTLRNKQIDKGENKKSRSRVKLDILENQIMLILFEFKNFP